VATAFLIGTSTVREGVFQGYHAQSLSGNIDVSRHVKSGEAKVFLHGITT
jgi:hypothetical protein